MSTKCSKAHVMNKMHLYTEAFNGEVHLELSNTSFESGASNNGMWLDVVIDIDLIKDLIAGLEETLDEYERKCSKCHSMYVEEKGGKCKHCE